MYLPDISVCKRNLLLGLRFVLQTEISGEYSN